MLAACLLLLIATASGTVLTFVYDRAAPLAARLCMGASTGLALMAMTGFLLALQLGLGPSCLVLTAAVMLLPFLLLLHAPIREAVSRGIKGAARPAGSGSVRPSSRRLAYAVFYAGLAVLLAAVFARAAYETPEGIFTGVRNNLGDLALHLQVISSFAQGQNFPPEDPTFAGVRFAYPFLVDFLTAMLIRAGAGVISAMWIQNMVLALALTGVIHYWTLLLTKNRLAGLIAPALVLFSGGLGWTWILQEVHATSHGLIPLLGHLPHDYTIQDPPGILRWGNTLTTLFVTQRSILFGMPLAICIFCLWWKAIADEAAENAQDLRGRMTAAGLFAGLLPLTHAHTFLVVMGGAACLALLFPTLGRGWLLFFAVAGIAALPQALWLGHAGGVHLRSYLAWQPGWDHGATNPALFWLVNTGLFIPLLLVALARRRPDAALPNRLLKYYAPFLLFFMVPNLVRLAPWIWDNIKVLVYWYVASVPLVALMLARGLEQRSSRRWLAGGALAALLLSGALDIFRVVAGQTEYREFDADGVALAHAVAAQAPPHALVLHAPTYNSPVFLTGRRSLLGYPGWIASRGLDYSQRQAEIARIYAGAADAEALMHRYRVDYVLISPAELSGMAVSMQFWSRYPEAARIGPYRLYRTNISEERAQQ